MSASTYLELEVLDHIFGKGTYTPPANIFVALATAAPTDTTTGSTLTEANYTSYARVSTAAADWNTAVTDTGTGLIDNANAITFPAATGGSSTVTHFALCDASTAGNILFYGALSASLSVTSGVTPEFAAGALDVRCE